MTSRRRRRLAVLLAPAWGAAVAAGLAGCGGDGGSVEEFCARSSVVRDLGPVFERFEPADPAASRSELDDAVREYRRLEEAAPGEIEDEVAAVADAVERLADALAGIDPEEPLSVFTQLEGLQDELAEVEGASRAVQDYASRECGVDLTGTVPTPPPG